MADEKRDELSLMNGPRLLVIGVPAGSAGDLKLITRETDSQRAQIIAIDCCAAK